MNKLARVLEYYGFNPDDEKIVCPFHADKNASLQINLNDEYWFCYGCQQWGHAYEFHKKYQTLMGNTNEIKILQLFNKIIKAKGKNTSGVKIEAPMVAKDAAYYRQCLIEAKDFYYGLKTLNWLEEDSEAADYMLYRGFRRRTLNRFGAKYTYKDITYPIVFPIMDNKMFKGYVMRTFDKQIAASKKYMYNKGFRRKSTIAGNYRGKVVMIVEGYFDMLKAKQFNVKNVGAILGWKITDKQIQKLLNEGVEAIIWATDNDKCGDKGYKYIKSLKKFKLIRFRYPDGTKDMGDMEYKLFKLEKQRIDKILKRRNLEWE